MYLLVEQDFSGVSNEFGFIFKNTEQNLGENYPFSAWIIAIPFEFRFPDAAETA